MQVLDVNPMPDFSFYSPHNGSSPAWQENKGQFVVKPLVFQAPGVIDLIHQPMEVTVAKQGERVRESLRHDSSPLYIPVLWRRT